MQQTGNWRIYELRDLVGDRFNWGMTMMPKGSAGYAGQLISEGYSIPAAAENKDDAWEFLKVMCSQEEGVERVLHGFLTAPRKDVLAAPELQEDPMWVTHHDFMLNTPIDPPHLPHNARVSEFWTLVNQAFEPLWLTNADMDEALQQLDSDVKDILAKGLP